MKTLNTFILDRSSSMQSILSTTLEAFNTYVQTLKDSKGDSEVDFTLVQFSDMGIDRTWFETPIEKVPLLDTNNYRPNGSTPLIEAAHKTILAVQAAVDKKKAAGEDVKVVVCIQTDGEENTSAKEYSWSSLKELIDSKIAAGWAFNFMGAGIDAYKQAAAMGIGTGNTVSYGTDLHATRSAFAFTAQNIGAYATGMATDTMYSSMQKMGAGDKFDPAGVVPVVNKSKTIDLGGGEAPKEKGLDVSL